MRHPHYTAKVFDEEKFSSLIISINEMHILFSGRKEDKMMTTKKNNEEKLCHYRISLNNGEKGVS